MAPGSAIITAGTRNGWLSFIESGVTAVSLRGRQIATLEAGDICGEIAMLSGEVHTCDVTALSVCKLLQVQAVHMMQLAQAHPELLNRLTALGNADVLQRASAVMEFVISGALVRFCFWARTQEPAASVAARETGVTPSDFSVLGLGLATSCSTNHHLPPFFAYPPPAPPVSLLSDGKERV